MCCMCDGMSWDEAQADLDRRKDRFGWVLQGVESRRPWAYTIGLTELIGHPELVMVGVPLNAAGAMLNDVGRHLGHSDELLQPGGSIRMGEVDLEIGDVHPVHIAGGLVGQWQTHYDRHPIGAPALAVVQLMPRPVRNALRLSSPHVTLD